MSKQEYDASRSVRKRSPHRGSRLVRADLKAYLDGELSGLRRWLVQWHLVRCAECREEVTWLQRLGKNMQNLEEARPSPSLRARILASLPDTPPPAPRFTQPSFAAQPSLLQRNGLRLALSGSLVVLALGGVFAFTRLHTSTPGQTQTAIVIKSSSPTPEKSAVAQQTPAAPPIVSNVPLQPLAPPAPDPFNEAATRYANEQIIKHAAQEAQQQQQDWNRMLASVRFGKNETKTAPTETVYVTLTVSDVSAAHQRLLAWAKQSGGAVVPVKNEGETGVASGVELLALRVPAVRGGAMLETLNHMGVVVAWSKLPLHEMPIGKKALPTKATAQEPVDNPPVGTTGVPKSEGNVKPEVSTKPELDFHKTVASAQEEFPSSVASVTITVLLEPVNLSTK